MTALPWLPEEEIHPACLRLELPIAKLIGHGWLCGNDNLSVFYYEKATKNGAVCYLEKLK